MRSLHPPVSLALGSLLALAPLAAPLDAQDVKPQEPAAKVDAPAKPAEKPTEPQPQKQKVPFLRPHGSYADLPELGFDPLSLLGGGGAPPKAFYPLLAAVEGLAKVAEPQVLLDLSGGIDVNLPQVRELERALGKVRAAGKHVTCYLEHADSAVFQIASQCDRVLMADLGVLDLRSPALSVMHVKDALDLLGLQVEVTRVGAFKGAVEPFMLPAMSAHLRAHYEAMLKTMNDDIVRRIAAGRKLGEDAVRALQGERLFPAKAAKERGLVDVLVPWSGARRALAQARGDDAFELVDATPKKKAQSRDLMALLASMLRQTKDEEIEDPQIVVMHLAGQIVDGDKPVPGSMVSGVAVKKLDELAANELVKGVVVRINSPGGSATASEAIRQALVRLAAKKPVVFSMGELAASGGYWITTIGKPILAEATTLTGSIGVFGMRLQAGALMRRIGVHTDVVCLDEGPLMDAIDRPWSEAARGRVQGFVDDVYERFVASVAESRRMRTDAVDAIAGGRVWSGQQAVGNGLVDAVGGLDDAVAMVRKEAALGDDVEVLHLPEPKSFADALFASMFEAQVQRAGDGARLWPAFAAIARCGEVAGIVREALVGDGRVRVWALMPAGLRVR